MKAIILLATLFACTLAQPFFEVQASSSGPMPIGSFDAATGTGSSFFTFGGAIDNFTAGTFEFSNALWKFNIESVNSGSWELMSPSGPTPSARGFHSIEKVVDDEGHAYLVLFGGAQFNNFFQIISQDKFYIYDILANTWEDASNLGGPQSRSLLCGASKGSKFYVVGGLDGFFQTKKDFWEFDINTRQWTELASFPGLGRHASTCGALDDKFVLYGGEALVFTSEGAEFQFPDDTWEFDFASGTWNEIDLPATWDIVPKRNYMPAVVSKSGNRLKIYGGDLEGGEAGCGAPFEQNVANDAYIYHRQTSRWQQRPAGGMVPPLKRHAAAQVGTFMYVVGGFDFICAGGEGPGQVWNTKVWSSVNA